MATYKHFLLSTPAPYVAHVEINRPSKLNAFYEEMWLEFKTVFDTLSTDPEVRAVILSGAGAKAFTAGLDVEAASQDSKTTGKGGVADVARKAVSIKRHIQEFQDCISAVERCEKRKYHGSPIGIENLADTAQRLFV
jgi:delta(3,5)-delta(2,4)-dienoyl-CoA isomerase